MKKEFSIMWKRSKQPRKQRKYRYNAPLHIKNKFMSVHFSKELRSRYKRRNITARKGDKINIVRGQFSGKTGKISGVDVKRCKIYVEGIEIVKKDGTKISPPIHPSNVVLIEITTDDKKRMKKLGKQTTHAERKE